VIFLVAPSKVFDIPMNSILFSSFLVPHFFYRTPSSLYMKYFIMDPRKSKRPSLPRLETDISPPPGRPAATTTSVPLAPVILPETNLRRTEAAPRLFGDSKREENVVPTVRYLPENKAFYVAEKSVVEAPVAKKKSQYYEEMFGHRGSHISPSEHVHQDSLVVAELKTNHKVRLYPVFEFMLRPLINYCTRSRMRSPSLSRMFCFVSLKSTSARKTPSWSRSSRKPTCSLAATLSRPTC